MSASTTSSASSKVNNVLVVGGTGGLGVHIVNGFLEPKWRGIYALHVLVRPDTAAKADKKQLLADWAERGAVVRFGTADDAKAATAATKGIDTVVSVVGGANVVSAQLALVEGAKASGVRRFVTSDYGLHTAWYRAQPGGLEKAPTAVFSWKQLVIDAAVRAGLEWTAIQTGLFASYLTGPLGINGDGASLQLVGGAATRYHITSRADIGALVPEVLALPQSRNTYLTLTGDVVTAQQAVDLWNRHVVVPNGGTAKEAKVLTRAELAKAQEGKQPSDLAHIFAGLQLSLVDGHGVLEQSESFNGRYLPSYRTQTVEEYFKAVGASRRVQATGA